MSRSVREPNFYAGGRLDRAAHLRQDIEWIAARLEDPDTRIVPIWRQRNLLAIDTESDQPPRGLYLRPGEARALADRPEAVDPVLLGLDGERCYFALDISPIEKPQAVPALAGLDGEFVDLRMAGPMMNRSEGALLAYARGITTWHRRHLFCGKCGSQTIAADGGHIRRCAEEACDTTHFPRTDPAVIMLVVKGDRCVLGRQARWPAGMYSTLAGFVEPGESLEDAVAREVFEESGIRVGPAVYHSSQPWPFPASLMLGFHAVAESEEITFPEQEMDDVRWFEKDDLQAHREGGEYRLPRHDSIARRLVEDWLDGEVEI